MEGIRGEVLRPNREFVDSYFTYIWKPVHKLTAATPSPFYFPLDPEKFKPYLEAEEARLSANLKGVNYFIDGIDTLPLITGVGRIEKVGPWYRHFGLSSAHLNGVDRLSSAIPLDETTLRDYANYADQDSRPA